MLATEKTALAPPGLPINLSLERWFLGGNLILLIGKELIRCFKGLYLCAVVFLVDVVRVFQGEGESVFEARDRDSLPSPGERLDLLELDGERVDDVFEFFLWSLLLHGIDE